MSAYLCDADHISAIVNAIEFSHYMQDTSLERYMTPGALESVRSGLCSWREALYNDLLQANLKSLGERYPDAPRMADWTDDDGAYRYRSMPRYESVVAAIKGANCYAYQSCEHEGWKASGAKRFCDELIDTLIGELPGYDEAAWGYEPPKRARAERARK